MPSYQIDVATEQGAVRVPFTLDDDRPLLAQVVQILEELRARGVMVKGGRDDELGAWWGGRDLDLMATPAALGLSPARPLELRMKSRAELAAAPVVRGPAKGWLAAGVSGVLGGALAWLLAGLVTDLSPAVPTFQRLDQFTFLFLGALPGLTTHLLLARRTNANAALGALGGFLLCGAGALVGASLVLLATRGADPSARSFLLARLGAWGLAGLLAAVLGGLWRTRIAPSRLAMGGMLGLLAGLGGALVLSLPGPSELWQGIAFALFGTGLGVALCAPALLEARALLEQPPATAPLPSLWSLREWPLVAGSVADVTAPGASCRLAAQPAGIALYPGEGELTHKGARVTQAVYVQPGEPITLGGRPLVLRGPR